MANAHRAAHCLAFGQGSWRKNPASVSEKYLVPTDSYLPKFNQSSWWWGTCDDDLRRTLWSGNSSRRPPREELSYEWSRTQGPGCEALNRGRSEPPSLEHLAKAFCEKWRGRRLLFVGDSQQAEIYTSFVQLVGLVNTTYNTKNPCYLRKLHYGAVGRGSQEIDVQAQLCESAPGGVVASFKRNEALHVDKATLSIILNYKNKPAMVCEWVEEALASDFVLLNRGMWITSDTALVRRSLIPNPGPWPPSAASHHAPPRPQPLLLLLCPLVHAAGERSQ